MIIKKNGAIKYLDFDHFVERLFSFNAMYFKNLEVAIVPKIDVLYEMLGILFI